jgi:phage/plasmid primase-like uncharacterized protein
VQRTRSVEANHKTKQQQQQQQNKTTTTTKTKQQQQANHKTKQQQQQQQNKTTTTTTTTTWLLKNEKPVLYISPNVKAIQKGNQSRDRTDITLLYTVGALVRASSLST